MYREYIQAPLPPILETRIVNGVVWARRADRDELDRTVVDEGFDPVNHPQWMVLGYDETQLRARR